MSEAFKYESSKCEPTSTNSVLETKTINGITCTWKGKLFGSNNDFDSSWEFNLDELGNKREISLVGYILAKRPRYSKFTRFDVAIDHKNNIIQKCVPNSDGFNRPNFSFEYYLTPIFICIEFQTEVLFSQSEKTNAILVVDEKKLHVNKELLSIHSDYFRALFSSNFKEGQMEEIPINDVSYEDLGLLLSIIHPMNTFPTDSTVEKLLELADLFLMPFVTRQVEHHLLHNSKMNSSKMMCLADKYGLSTLLKKVVLEMDSAEKAKEIQKSTEYKSFSDKTKAALFDRVVQFI